MSDLVGNPEDRFSRVEAQITLGMNFWTSKVRRSSSGTLSFIIIEDKNFHFSFVGLTPENIQMR